MKTLIEDCFRLSTKLLKNDLRKTRQREPIVNGYLNIVNQGKSAVLDYKIEYVNDNAYLEVYFDAEPQRILLSEEQLTFGIRTYLTCPCGQRTNALYLKKNFFACRNCHKLCYQSSTINRKSRHGQVIYQLSRKIKLMNDREKLWRIFYKSKYTKRYKHWLIRCSRAGLIDETTRAIKLQELVKGTKSVD